MTRDAYANHQLELERRVEELEHRLVAIERTVGVRMSIADRIIARTLDDQRRKQLQRRAIALRRRRFAIR